MISEECYHELKQMEERMNSGADRRNYDETIIAFYSINLVI